MTWGPGVVGTLKALTLWGALHVFVAIVLDTVYLWIYTSKFGKTAN